jgi:hypothetical protein
MNRIVAILCALALMGCAASQTEVRPKVLSCSETRECPSGMSCEQGVCRGVDGCAPDGDCQPVAPPRAPQTPQTPRVPPRPGEAPG